MATTGTNLEQPDNLDWLCSIEEIEPPPDDLDSIMSDHTSVDLVPNFPAELKRLPNWVLWKLSLNDAGKLTKVPFQTAVKNHEYLKAASDDPSTWTAFDAVCSKLPAITSEKGIGFQLGVNGCGYLFLDFDGCRNPKTHEIAKWAEDFLVKHRTYTEISPSGEGLRAIYKGQPQLPNGSGTWKVVSPRFARLPGVEKTPALELFTHHKYVTVTGNSSGPALRDIAGYGGFLPELEAFLPPSTATAAPDAEIVRKDFSNTDKFKLLFAGKWQEAKNVGGNPYPSMSEAVSALCVMLAYKHGNDVAAIEQEFRSSQLYRDYPKWDRQKNRQETYGQYFTAHGLSFAASHPPTEEPSEPDSEPLDTPEIPVFPLEILDGNYIGELTRLLTEGTNVPPVFVYNNIKCILGSVLDGKVGFPNHSDLHTRQYTVNVSVHPRTGKGVSWKRTGDVGSYLRPILDDGTVNVLDGGKVGSGEFLVKVLKGYESENGGRIDVLARFDEMAEVFGKAQTRGSTLEAKLLQLYERNEIAQGSFKNGEYEVKNLHFSLSGDFTRASFARFFAGAGAIGSGFLARCTFGYADKVAVNSDWSFPSKTTTDILVEKIRARIVGSSRPALEMIPDVFESDDARMLRLEFFQRLNQKDANYVPELEAHFKRDLLLRAIFSEPGAVTPDFTRQSILWTEYQYDVRESLWPIDAGTLEAQMEARIIKALKGRQLTARDLQKRCHVERPETGGYEVFNRALKALTTGGRVTITGHTRVHSSIYTVAE